MVGFVSNAEPVARRFTNALPESVCCARRLLEVSGGSEPGFDHCFCRGGVSGEGSARATATAMGVGREAAVAM